MNAGVEIILQRMKDNPDDFDYGYTRGGMSKWMRLIDHAIGSEILTEEEHQAIKDGLKEAKRSKFTEMVMTHLAGEDEAGDEGKTLMSSSHPRSTVLGGVTQGLSSAYSNTTASQLSQTQQAYQLAQMQAQMAQNSYNAGLQATQGLGSAGTGATWTSYDASTDTHTVHNGGFMSKLFGNAK